MTTSTIFEKDLFLFYATISVKISKQHNLFSRKPKRTIL